MSKRLGEIWKTLPEEEKAPYAAQAAADQERIAQLEGGAEGGASTSVSKPKAKRSKPDKKKSVSKAASDNEDDEDATPEEDTVDAAAKAAAKKKRKNDKVRVKPVTSGCYDVSKQSDRCSLFQSRPCAMLQWHLIDFCHASAPCHAVADPLHCQR